MNTPSGKLKQTAARVQKFSAGVDWLQITADDHKHWRHVNLVLLPEQQRAEREGSGYRPSGQNGYYGRRTDHAFWGRRDDGLMAQASSALADELFMPLMSCATRVPRLDVQLTCWYAEDVRDILDETLAAADAWNATRKKPLYIKANVASRRAETIYIGSPASDQRGRVYNKFEESRDERYRGSVRFEVQLRNRRAMAAAKYLTGQPQRALASAALVKGWYNMRGTPIPDVSPLTALKLVLAASKKSSQKTLGWLASEVSPAILRMVQEVGPEETAAALFSAFRESDVTGALLQSLIDAVGN